MTTILSHLPQITEALSVLAPWATAWIATH